MPRPDGRPLNAVLSFLGDCRCGSFGLLLSTTVSRRTQQAARRRGLGASDLGSAAIPPQSHCGPGRARSDLRTRDRQRRATRKALTMGRRAAPDGALGGGRSSVGNVGGWLNACAYRAELAFCVVRDLATTVRDSIRRRVSGCGAARIHVSGMSDSWLRVHETECNKHRAEL